MNQKEKRGSGRERALRDKGESRRDRHVPVREGVWSANEKEKHEPAGCGITPRICEQKGAAGIPLTFASKSPLCTCEKRGAVSRNEKKKKKIPRQIGGGQQ
jgi:hypothetical protein